MSSLQKQKLDRKRKSDIINQKITKKSHSCIFLSIIIFLIF